VSLRFASEVLPMKTLIRTCRSQDCQVEVPEAFGDGSICLEHYLAEATEKLDESKDSFLTGQGVDGEALDWLLAQVDFVVEAIGNDDLTLEEEQRSGLLQLLLAIANLNECIHHDSATLRAGR
jgi:hypothetical protein